eukprot:m.250975 g.250975  ORF g.250975 m.250975 type:complete len:65 (-) comp17516_c1_seq68:116-310(-)
MSAYSVAAGQTCFGTLTEQSQLWINQDCHHDNLLDFEQTFRIFADTPTKEAMVMLKGPLVEKFE